MLKGTPDLNSAPSCDSDFLGDTEQPLAQFSWKKNFAPLPFCCLTYCRCQPSELACATFYWKGKSSSMWPGWSSIQHRAVSSSREEQLCNTEHNSAALQWHLQGSSGQVTHGTSEGVSAFNYVLSGICYFCLVPVLVPVNNNFLFCPNFFQF